MNTPIPSNGGFFPTRRQRDLMMKSLDHLMGCDCTTDSDIEVGFELIDIVQALNSIAVIELDDMAKSWDEPGVEE